jgi:hypothetical protein
MLRAKTNLKKLDLNECAIEDGREKILVEAPYAIENITSLSLGRKEIGDIVVKSLGCSFN